MQRRRRPVGLPVNLDCHHHPRPRDDGRDDDVDGASHDATTINGTNNDGSNDVSAVDDTVHDRAR